MTAMRVGFAADHAGAALRTELLRRVASARPGDTILIEVKLTERVSNAFFMSARVTCEGKLAAALDFACTLAESG